MILSMTGFGKGSAEANGTMIEAEAKSLNSRFLDLQVRLPKDFSDKEFEIRERIKKRITRGKISLYINVQRESGSEKVGSIDADALKSTVALLNQMKDIINYEDKVNLDQLLSLQNLYFKEAETDTESEYPLLEKAVDKALDGLIEMKKQEGKALQADLTERVNNISESLDKVKEKGRGPVEEYFDKLKQRAKQLTSELNEYPDRLNMELALLAEKYDVTEECVRLASHIKMFMETLNESAEAGRKLNFITQEMNREVNTINSKSISSEVSHLGIFMKEELEKIREQIQNLE